MLEPGTSVQFVKGIGPRFAEMLATKGIHTVDDLLFYLPFRYEDRVNPRRIASLRTKRRAPCALALLGREASGSLADNTVLSAHGLEHVPLRFAPRGPPPGLAGAVAPFT